jgi:hypothetical protein
MERFDVPPPRAHSLALYNDKSDVMRCVARCTWRARCSHEH